MISLRQNDTHDSPLSDLVPDLTPLLDILFILLVFFMITAGVVFQSLDLTLPAAVSESSPATADPDLILLEIREDGYVVDGVRATDFSDWKNLMSEVMSEKPRRDLVIAGDRRVEIENLLKVLAHLQSRGIKSADILMRDEPTR